MGKVKLATNVHTKEKVSSSMPIQASQLIAVRRQNHPSV